MSNPIPILDSHYFPPAESILEILPDGIPLELMKVKNNHYLVKIWTRNIPEHKLKNITPTCGITPEYISSMLLCLDIVCLGTLTAPSPPKNPVLKLSDGKFFVQERPPT